jgi:LPS-assembly protein
MKNKLFIIFYFFFFNSLGFAENIFIESKSMSFDKVNKISIFEKEVFIKTNFNKTIKSDYAEYDKATGLIKLKNNIFAVDDKNNKIETQFAIYDENTKIFKSLGPTKIFTTEKYIVESADITFDNSNNYIKSEKKTLITDEDDNKIFLENFEYLTEENIFKSIGLINIKDNMTNNYKFSQIYIDTQKKEILGTDSKAFFNNENFKINNENNPRIFSNTIKIDSNNTSFKKSSFTLCGYRKNDKCPPWSINASEMLHDKKKKTIYYDNAVIKVYDIPIFYLPKLSHPDPTVDRRSGFLPPSFSDTKNLGSGISIPYFFAIGENKNFTLTNNLYASENPLTIGEYHQAFKSSNLLFDFGYTEGFKKKSTSKRKMGDKSHFFTKFTKNFSKKKNDEKNLTASFQNVSDDKYLKLYKIKSNLVDYNTSTLENSLNFTNENENSFFGFNASIYETLEEHADDKYEYILPEINLDKNLFSNDKFGSLDLQTNYKIRKYETNKYTNFLINDLHWNFKEINFDSGLTGKFLGNLKNINYETKNEDLYKKDPTNELFGAIGYLSEINLQKTNSSFNHLLKPKMLLRFAPGEMRKENTGSRLNPDKAFSIDRLDNINNFETGLSTTLGFDYNMKKNEKKLDFSVAQIINNEENKKMATETSLDEKVSDLTGSMNYQVNNNLNFNYNFLIDQNYNEFNYNEIGAKIDFNSIAVDFNYLQENKHIGDQEYFKTKIDFAKNKNGLASFETKRNLVTNSSEFYNLSYEYINDCLRAGLVYRREFYNDSELEPENSLMFKVTLTPFGNINSPSFNE